MHASHVARSSGRISSRPARAQLRNNQIVRLEERIRDLGAAAHDIVEIPDDLSELDEAAHIIAEAEIHLGVSKAFATATTSRQRLDLYHKLVAVLNRAVWRDQDEYPDEIEEGRG